MVDQPAAAGDDVVELRAGTLVSFTANGQVSIQVLEGGELIFLPDLPNCKGSADHACRATLKKLAFHLRDFEADLSDGETLSVKDVVSTVAAPLVLEDDGTGYRIPAATTYQTCATVDGHPDNGQSPSDQDTVLNVDEALEQLEAIVHFDLVVHANNDNCSEQRVAVAFEVGGNSPWQQASNGP